jgi:uncharacterized damage-inducible protein DinB
MDRQFPIGKLEPINELTNEKRLQLILELENFSAKFAKAIAEVTDSKLDQPYRDGGWTRRQVIHHLADAHLNFYMRVKLALTEEQPTIKAFDEEGWANLADSQLPIESATVLIQATIVRLFAIFKSLSEADFQKTFIHPANGRANSLNLALQIVVWHGNHHLAHVELD